MKRIAAICVTAGLMACNQGHAAPPPTTTSATLPASADGGRPHEPLEPVPRTDSEPVWSPSPQPGSSQMPFDPRGFTAP